MRVNIFVEDLLFFKYIGCATAARTLYRQLSRMNELDISWNSNAYDYDLVHYHTFGPLSLFNRKYSQGVKVLTAHSTPRINEGNVAFSHSINQYYPRIYRKFDHIITISAPCQREVERMHLGVPTTLIPNGIDREFFRRDAQKRQQFRERYGIGEDERVVLTVAQQTPRKGIYDFLQLSKQFPDLRWVWVGGFPYGALSKDYLHIEQSKLQCGKNVLFTGIVPDIVGAYSGADIFFMPSYAETFGLVILEAMSCDLPLIVRGIPEFREIYGDMALYFFDLDQAAALLKDEAALRRCAANARENSAAFDIKRVAEMHRHLYRELTGA
ncbi:MAG: glycosyltransferase family 4 protein [Methanomicrobiales archaeon]|nr:glycosyltransferase family 4 protein [Methanomicrobiales archaeon]MDI6876372.1 glycosyltransferase family 4 protein [Methanomicrobiales archaeon]